MKSPKDMRVIQIDITNACPHQCSNCTRMCGNHKKPFFMDFDTFKRAVDSLIGFPGTIGIMGGEPTLHPEFEKFVRHLDSKLPPEYKKRTNNFIYPQSQFIDAIHDQEWENRTASYYCGGMQSVVPGAGLWSSVGATYKKHYEIIQDVFKHQPINDHGNVMHHQPALVARKDLGISDEEWTKLRDNCWINQMWSATITPKGAFFCEIAGALDMLFDGPGGWPIEPGWWKREPRDFGEQLKWCEICGMALNTFSRDAREEVDDVSITLFEKLKEVDSPKLRNGKINLIKVENGVIAEESKAGRALSYDGLVFADSYESRISDSGLALCPDGIVEVIELNDDKLLYNVNSMINAYEECWKKIFLLVYSEELANKCAGIIDNSNVIVICETSFGCGINKIMSMVSDDEYIMLHTPNILFNVEKIEYLKHCVINPGVMHYTNLNSKMKENNPYISNADIVNCGYAALFNKRAISLREIGYDGVHYCDNIEQLVNKWNSKKVVELSSKMDYKVPDIYIKKGLRYAIYGAGGKVGYIIGNLRKMGMFPIMISDSDANKWGKDVCGYKVVSPDELLERKDEYDKIIISSWYYYGSIKKDLLKLGIAASELSMGEYNAN